MKRIIDPGRAVETVTMIDHIVYSNVKDRQGNELKLELSVMSAMGNSEMAAALGRTKPEEHIAKKPAVLWYNGGSWRGVDKNSQIGELVFLAKAGYVVVCAYYRSIFQGQFPDQLIDAKTAVRFLRAHSLQYSVDPDRIAVMGRSAGGQLAAMVGTNDGKYISSEWAGYSSNVSCVWDMFGPADLKYMAELHLKELAEGKLAGGRWGNILETAEGAALGGPEESLLERAEEFSPRWNISRNMAPILIMHGDADPLIPWEMSEDFYNALCRTGKEGQSDFCLVRHAGHGTAEFFQEESQKIALDFFGKWL